jgi:hypothetical protein
VLGAVVDLLRLMIEQLLIQPLAVDFTSDLNAWCHG